MYLVRQWWTQDFSDLGGRVVEVMVGANLFGIFPPKSALRGGSLLDPPILY